VSSLKFNTRSKTYLKSPCGFDDPQPRSTNETFGASPLASLSPAHFSKRVPRKMAFFHRLESQSSLRLAHHKRYIRFSSVLLAFHPGFGGFLDTDHALTVLILVFLTVGTFARTGQPEFFKLFLVHILPFAIR
jgi:hypothetical protein